MANRPYNFVLETGIIIPDTDSVVTVVQEDFKEVFGQALILDPSTPQGVFIASEASARQSVVRNTAAIANQFNPDRSGGVYLDAMMMMLGGQRKAGIHSEVIATLGGVSGTLIPRGALATTLDGDIFASVDDVIIQGDGLADTLFRAQAQGPIPAPAGELTRVTSGVLGWETVTNNMDAALGRQREGDLAARRRRRLILGIQGVSGPEAITGAVSDVDGVRSIAFRENVTSVPVVIDGTSLVGHSIYVCADGGSDNDIAQALYASKSIGSNYNGNTAVTIQDPFSKQSIDVLFQRPETVVILIEVTARQGTSLTNPIPNIIASVLAYASGELTEEQGFVVGGDVSPAEISSAVGRGNPRLFIDNVQIMAAGGTFGNDVIPISIEQVPTINAADITVVIV